MPHLRNFLEDYPISSNNNQPINPAGPEQRSYVIICTHCHFDHILGIPQFTSSTTAIAASSAGKSFIEDNLPEHSLCKWLGLRTPQYKVTQWMDDVQRLNWKFAKGQMTDLDIVILQTPGHTPDSLSWYDCTEHHLYVGDTLYELGETDDPIVFTEEGDWFAYMASLRKLLDFVRREDSEIVNCMIDHCDGAVAQGEKQNEGAEEEETWTILPIRIKLSCGHTTTGVDAEEIIEDVLAFFDRIIQGCVPVVKSEIIRGQVCDTWKETGKKSPRFAVRAPRRLCEDVRRRKNDVAL